MRIPIWKVIFVACIITVSLASCLPGASANEYDLTASLNEGKFPDLEMDRIAYGVREEVESLYRWNTEWLVYWSNAEMIGRCGTIKVNDLQVGETNVPLEPIQLQNGISVEAWIEYSGYTESQFFDDLPDVPINKTVKGTILYKNESWEVKSIKEMDESLSAYCP